MTTDSPRWKTLLKFFQPDGANYNVWNIIIAFLSLLLMQYLENHQRMKEAYTNIDDPDGMWNKLCINYGIPTTPRFGVYGWMLINSGPNTLIGMSSILTLACPKIYHVISNHIFTNALVLTAQYKGQTYGSGLGLALMGIYIGRGYGAKTGFAVPFVSSFVGPIVSMALYQVPDVVDCI